MNSRSGRTRAFTHHQERRQGTARNYFGGVDGSGIGGGPGPVYTSEIVELTGQLGSIAEGTDLDRACGASIAERATQALKACVEKMAEENKGLVSHLSAEVNDYRTRLAEAERVSNTDPLTDLANRRAFENILHGGWTRSNHSC